MKYAKFREWLVELEKANPANKKLLEQLTIIDKKFSSSEFSKPEDALAFIQESLNKIVALGAAVSVADNRKSIVRSHQKDKNTSAIVAAHSERDAATKSAGHVIDPKKAGSAFRELSKEYRFIKEGKPPDEDKIAEEKRHGGLEELRVSRAAADRVAKDQLAYNAVQAAAVPTIADKTTVKSINYPSNLVTAGEISENLRKKLGREEFITSYLMDMRKPPQPKEEIFSPSIESNMASRIENLLKVNGLETLLATYKEKLEKDIYKMDQRDDLYPITFEKISCAKKYLTLLKGDESPEFKLERLKESFVKDMPIEKNKHPFEARRDNLGMIILKTIASIFANPLGFDVWKVRGKEVSEEMKKELDIPAPISKP